MWLNSHGPGAPGLQSKVSSLLGVDRASWRFGSGRQMMSRRGELLVDGMICERESERMKAVR